jgi:uncharacterized protein (DUF302 family)
MPPTNPPDLGIKIQTRLTYDDAVARVRELLPEEGFGVLTEIDVQSTLKAKLDADFRRYVILGACNPQLAHRALSSYLDIGLLLPCNIIVYENEDGAATVNILEPIAALGMIGRPELADIAAEAAERLHRVAAALAGAGA